MRRNAFWLAYAVERQHGCGNGWALSLDDQDISQLLPLRGDQFENSVILHYALLDYRSLFTDLGVTTRATMGP